MDKIKKEEHYEILDRMKWYYASMPIIDDYYNITKEELERVREQSKITELFLDLQRAILEFKYNPKDWKWEVQWEIDNNK